MRKTELMREISKRTNISEQYIYIFFEALRDIAIEQITNSKEPFRIPGIAVIKKLPWRGGAKDINGNVLKDHYRLDASISPSVRKLFKLKQNAPYVEITRDNWRGILATTARSPRNTLSISEEEFRKMSQEVEEMPRSDIDSMVQSFLDEDDEF